MKSTMRRVTGGLAAGLIAVTISFAGASTASAATHSVASPASTSQANDQPNPFPVFNFLGGFLNGFAAPLAGLLNGPLT